MVRIKKCQSAKHSSGGCGNPRCPEGLSIQAVMEEAVQKHDLNSYLVIKEKQESVERYHNDNLTLTSSGAEIAKAPRYTVENLERGLNSLYPRIAEVQLDTSQKSGMKRVEIYRMDVAEGHRGKGIGRHLRATVLNFAAENGYAVFGTPTEEGTKERDRFDTEEEYKKHCLDHRKRLEKFYIDSGYEYNYAYDSRCLPDNSRVVTTVEIDDLTGEPYPRNSEWEKQFSPEALIVLKASARYVRWPKGEIPDSWKA